MRPAATHFRRADLPADTGPRLRATREAIGVGRGTIAGAAGIAPRTLARIERGAQKPTMATLSRICVALDIDLFEVAPLWADDAFDLPEHAGVAPGIAFRAVRRARGMSMARAASLLGVSVATLSRFERGITVSRLLAGVGGGSRSIDLEPSAGIRGDPAERVFGEDAAVLRWLIDSGLVNDLVLAVDASGG